MVTSRFGDAQPACTLGTSPKPPEIETREADFERYPLGCHRSVLGVNTSRVNL